MCLGYASVEGERRRDAVATGCRRDPLRLGAGRWLARDPVLVRLPDLAARDLCRELGQQRGEARLCRVGFVPPAGELGELEADFDLVRAAADVELPVRAAQHDDVNRRRAFERLLEQLVDLIVAR